MDRYLGEVLAERMVSLADGRGIRVYDSGPQAGTSAFTVFWHHGTPQSGLPPTPLVAAADAQGVRWLSIDRPGYLRSTPLPGRDVAAVAADVAAVADALGVGRFAVVGASGGGPHALACAALLSDRVVAAACLATVAPFHAEGLDWLAGMAPSGRASFEAAIEGREAFDAYQREHSPEESVDLFAPEDYSVFTGPYWPWFQASVVEASIGVTDDMLAFVRRWGFDPGAIQVPLLLLHGERDLAAPPAHSRWLADRCAGAELRMTPAVGHLSIFDCAAGAVDWLRDRGGCHR